LKETFVDIDNKFVDIKMRILKFFALYQNLGWKLLYLIYKDFRSRICIAVDTGDGSTYPP